MADDHANFAYSTVTVAPSPAASGTTLTVADETEFPTAPFNATVWPLGALPLASNAEIVRVTDITGSVFTVTRTQEGSSARTILVGDQIAATITDKTLTDIEGHADETTSVHGITDTSALVTDTELNSAFGVLGPAESSGGTVTYGMPGREFHTSTTIAQAANFDYYFPFQVARTITLDSVAFQVTTGPASNATVYLGIYESDARYQPTGAPLLNTSAAVTAAATGVFTTAISVTLQPGTYLAAMNTTVDFTVRYYAAPAKFLPATMAGLMHGQQTVGRTAAAFPNPGTEWSSAGGFAAGYAYRCFFRW